jgi:hypothetical protein
MHVILEVENTDMLHRYAAEIFGLFVCLFVPKWQLFFLWRGGMRLCYFLVYVILEIENTEYVHNVCCFF